jgi:hypothetical protein
VIRGAGGLLARMHIPYFDFFNWGTRCVVSFFLLHAEHVWEWSPQY